MHSSLHILPGADTLGARLAMFLLGVALVALVLLILTGLEMTGLAPVRMGDSFVIVAFGASLAILVMAAGLWLAISREVLRPLEQIRIVLNRERRESERSGRTGLGQVAATMREMRDTVQRTQAELDESNRNLRHVEKLAMVGKLAAGVAHSVRNPLTAVKLRLFSLERSLALSSRQRDDFAVIADAIRHVDGIVSNFLEFSRRPRLKPVEVSPTEVLEATLRLLENRLAGFPVSLAVNRAPSMPLVLADPDQLREALLNIMLNACEAMDYSGKLLVDELVLKEDSGVYACITVRDSGPGIPEDILQDIFTPFFSTKEQGTGLGLPIARSILEEHGGDIRVSSSKRDGTSFTLLLPVLWQ